MKSRRPPVSSDCRLKNASRGADYGPAERWQHSGRVLELTAEAGVLAARAVDSDILDSCLAEGIIDTRQRDAALRLRADFHTAGMTAHLIGSYNPARSTFSVYGGWDERTEEEEKAYRRWREAIQAIGAMYSDFVISVVCFEETQPQERLFLLTAGLIKLARFYGIPKSSDEHVHKASAGQVAARRGGKGEGRGSLC